MSDNLRELAMPRLGIAMDEGSIVRWLKAEGEEVERDEVLLVIETDKVEVDIPSPWTGVVVQVLAREGEVVKILQPIARIREKSMHDREGTADEHSS